MVGHSRYLSEMICDRTLSGNMGFHADLAFCGRDYGRSAFGLSEFNGRRNGDNLKISELLLFLTPHPALVSRGF